MRTKRFSCPNGCCLPPRKKQLVQSQDGTYKFDYNDFTFCPNCGSLMPYSQEALKAFFKVYNIHPDLKNALNFIYKSEYEAASREAFVTVETTLKKKSGLDSHGFDLATKALSFEVDKKTGQVVKAPLVSINDLKTDSERNEQDGIRYMLMGFFQGPRNIFQHNHVGSGVSDTLSIVIEASFFLYLLNGHSMTKNGKWIESKISYKDIYSNMPEATDRKKLIRMLKRRNLRQENRKRNNT